MVPAPRKSSTVPAKVPVALRALLSGLIDYAGMFPPAKLSLEEAAHNFLQYARGPQAWMLGKFVVPAAQLGELRRFLEESPESHGVVSGLSVLLGAEPVREAALIRAALLQVAGENRPRRFSIDAVEFRPGSPAVLAGISAALPPGLPVFCELPFVEELPVWLAAIRQNGWSAKMRTGGVTPEAFPASNAVAEFMAQCKAHGVAFKATAGLHHPVRSEHPLTYDANSPCGVMHGFLNVFLGAALLECGISKEQLVEVLDETEATNFRFSGEFAHWRKLFVNENDVAGARRRFAISFGSCSFEEPTKDLQKLGLL